jgi:hypothetical protein
MVTTMIVAAKMMYLSSSKTIGSSDSANAIKSHEHGKFFKLGSSLIFTLMGMSVEKNSNTG